MVIDALYENVSKKGIVCLGLDTSPDYLPDGFKNKFSTAAEAVFEFNRQIIDETCGAIACYKVQIAYYEALGIEGLQAYARTLKYIRAKNVPVIADVKRGDIKDTAAMYAKAHFTGDFESDFMTLNPYLGFDSLEPYKPYFNEKGCFVLMRTSNPGAKDIQYLRVEGAGSGEDGASGEGGANGVSGVRNTGGANGAGVKSAPEQKNVTSYEMVYNVVADGIINAAGEFTGASGYSSIGAVMGCTNAEEIKAIRERMASIFFLIPGYGAQGGEAKTVSLFLKNKTAAL